MHRPRNRLARWQRLSLNATALLLAFTGVAWLAVHYGVGAGAGELPHPAEAWLVKLHGAAGFAALFMLGVLATVHLPRGWKITNPDAHHAHGSPQEGHALEASLRSHRRTGIALSTLASLLVLSGYALYYFAPEPLRPALGWVHAGAGLAMAGIGLWHARLLAR